MQVDKNNLVITLECEFGNSDPMMHYGNVIELRHHGIYSSNVSVCRQLCRELKGINSIITETTKIFLLYVTLDLDTMMSIFIIKNKDHEMLKNENFIKFINAIDKADQNGIHTLDDSFESNMVRTYHILANECKIKTLDQEQQLEKGISFINQLTDIGNVELVNETMKKEQQRKNEVEECLVKESSFGRLFKTPGIFCGADYNEKLFIVSFNEQYEAITLSLKTTNDEINACKIMQIHFGNEADGNYGIAGTPRGKKFKFEQAEFLFVVVQKMFEKLN